MYCRDLLHSGHLFILDSRDVAEDTTVPLVGNTHRRPSFKMLNASAPLQFNISPPSPGVFTAPLAGIYVFSCTVYSHVDKGSAIHHKVNQADRQTKMDDMRAS